jgi:enoyl-CoA hydratase/carnithine racemase
MASTAKLGYPEVKHGIVAAIVMANLVRNVGARPPSSWWRRASRSMPSAPARRVVNRVTAPEQLMADAGALAEKLAAVHRPAAAATSNCSPRLDLPFEQALEEGRDINQRMRAFRTWRPGYETASTRHHSRPVARARCRSRA